jgi:hypothetical protein
MLRRFMILSPLLLAFVPAVAFAQLLPPEGSNALTDAFNKDQQATIRRLLRGEEEATKDSQPAIELLAKWHTYRYTWQDNQDKPNAINKLYTELDNDLKEVAKNKPATQAFQHLFVEELVKTSREVLQNSKVIAQVNAARVLARAAQTGEEVAADPLVDILKDPQKSDGVKYWALRGLQDLFAPGVLQVPPAPMKDQARQTRCVLALLDFLDRKVPTASLSTREEIEGQRTLRREAIRALALTRYPAVVDDKNKIQGRTALTLLRIIRKDGFVPEPRWDEQIEAAIGIGRLQSGLFPDYQPDYAAQNMGVVIVEFAQKYTDEERGKVEKGWRYYAARLGEALAAMRADVAKTSKDKEVVAYIDEFVRRGSEQLRLIETKGEANPAKFSDWLQNAPIKSDTVYKGVADSKVKLTETNEK